MEQYPVVIVHNHGSFVPTEHQVNEGSVELTYTSCTSHLIGRYLKPFVSTIR